VPKTGRSPSGAYVWEQSLTAALQLRRSTREYADRPLPLQLLSDLLWAGFGVNRANGDRTAPIGATSCAGHLLAMADGVWLYERHASTRASPHGDIGNSPAYKTRRCGAARTDLRRTGERMTDVSPEDALYASSTVLSSERTSTCSVHQKARNRLSRVGRSYKLAHLLMLPDGQFVTFAQTVGYPQHPIML